MKYALNGAYMYITSICTNVIACVYFVLLNWRKRVNNAHRTWIFFDYLVPIRLPTSLPVSLTKTEVSQQLIVFLHEVRKHMRGHA